MRRSREGRKGNSDFTLINIVNQSPTFSFWTPKSERQGVGVYNCHARKIASRYDFRPGAEYLLIGQARTRVRLCVGAVLMNQI